MKQSVIEFKKYLEQEEKSKATIEKYLHDVRTFYQYLEERQLSKEETIQYKEYLSQRYSAVSTNSMLVALNCFLRFCNKPEACVKLLKIQRQIFCRQEKELTRAEYQRLIKAAGNSRISIVIQTICGTGIRVSELRNITVEAVKEGRAVVNCKNKVRIIFIPAEIQKLLNKYIKKSGLTAGAVFVSKNGKPLNRSNIWRDMKALCTAAGVAKDKVFPHNLRHLFARTFYGIEKDIAKLADILGHSSINTTRIYTIETGNRHMNQLEQVQKLLTT